MIRGFVRRSPAAPILLLCVASAACATARAGPRDDELEPGGTVITREEILEMDVRTALEVIERSARTLLIQRTREGSPVRIYHRGVDSILLGAEIAVVVDGALVSNGIRTLESIPAESIRFVQLLSAREGATRYGSDAGNGVIVIRTGAG